MNFLQKLLTERERQDLIIDTLLGYHIKEFIPERPLVKPLTLRQATKILNDLVVSHAEMVIGEDEQMPKGIKAAESFYSAQNELRAEQRERNKL